MGTFALDTFACGLMVAGKKLTDFTSLFSPCDFKKNDHIKNVISKMNKTSKTNLSEQIKFQLSKIIGIGDYFHQEINRRKSCSKKLSKYVTASDYIDKILIVLSATSNGVYIILSASVFGAPVGIASASFTLIFSFTTGIKKLLTITKKA